MHPINSIRSEIVSRRTYQRFLASGRQEEWSETVARCINHSKWLEEMAGGYTSPPEEFEELRQLFLTKKAFPSGRGLWLSGTPTGQKQALNQFNCSFLNIATVFDIVDAFHALLCGCGVGAKMIPGVLTSFKTRIPNLEIVPSTRTNSGGREHNVETFSDNTWRIVVGDSATAWAKFIGKLFSGKVSVSNLILDFSEIRPAGELLRGYGWRSQGYEPLAKAATAIFHILNESPGTPLSGIQILDCLNHLGTTLSSRRSAQIVLKDYDNLSETQLFIHAKDDLDSFPHRTQSNNSILFSEFPGEKVVSELISTMVDSGKGEPGIFNKETAKERAPWFEGTNPCGEILLADGGLCNLSELVISSFSSFHEAERAIYILGRNNYRQTLVSLRDGILQDKWQENNEELRLCGVSLTGIQQAPSITSNYQLTQLRRAAQAGAISMAVAFGKKQPGNVTCVKPSGTLAKVAGCSEGCHFPISPFLLNNINFSKNDPLVEVLRKANYSMRENPYDATAVIVAIPVNFEGATAYSREVSAVRQLEEYRRLMKYYCDQNVSCTVSYSPEEGPEIVKWLCKYWSEYVGVSFLPRENTNTGYAYRPQEVVEENTWNGYVARLQPIKWADGESIERVEEVQSDSDCENGVCPVR